MWVLPSTWQSQHLLPSCRRGTGLQEFADHADQGLRSADDRWAPFWVLACQHPGTGRGDQGLQRQPVASTTDQLQHVGPHQPANVNHAVCGEDELGLGSNGQSFRSAVRKQGFVDNRLSECKTALVLHFSEPCGRSSSRG